MDAAIRLAYMLRRTSWTLDMTASLYARVRSLAEGPYAESALAAVSFAESSFFPIPPDVLLAPMALANPRRAWRYALIATVASVIGGMLGYAIGALLFNTVGQWLINLYGYGAKVDALKQTYAQWGWLVILVKGVTPIPYKLVTITSGLLGYNFPLFVALSVLTRGARFFLGAGVLHWFGEPLRTALERNFAAALAGIRRAGRRRLRDRDQGLLMTPAEIVMAPSLGLRALWIAVASAVILAAVWILSGARLCALRALPHPALCLLCRRSHCAPDGVRQPFGARPGAGRLRASRSRVRRQHGPRRLSRRGRTALVGGPHGLHRRPRIPRRQRPRESARSVKVVRCDEVQLRIAGLSLAGWNVVASAKFSRPMRRSPRGFRA